MSTEAKTPVVEQSEQAKLIQSILKELVPVIVEANKGSQLTPEILNEMKKPYVDPVQAARNLRMSRDNQRELLEQAEQRKWEQEHCKHETVAPGGGHKTTSISLITNERTFVGDEKPRGICSHCYKYFRPEHWVIDYDPENKNGKPRLVPADPQYHLVEEIQSALSSGNNYY